MKRGQLSGNVLLVFGLIAVAAISILILKPDLLGGGGAGGIPAPAGACINEGEPYYHTCDNQRQIVSHICRQGKWLKTTEQCEGWVPPVASPFIPTVPPATVTPTPWYASPTPTTTPTPWYASPTPTPTTCSPAGKNCGRLNSAGLPCCPDSYCTDQYLNGVCLKKADVCSPAGDACGRVNSAGRPCCAGLSCSGTIGWEYCVSGAATPTPSVCSPAGNFCGAANSRGVSCCADSYCTDPLNGICLKKGSCSPSGDKCGRVNSAGRTCCTGNYCSDPAFGICVKEGSCSPKNDNCGFGNSAGRACCAPFHCSDPMMGACVA